MKTTLLKCQTAHTVVDKFLLQFYNPPHTQKNPTTKTNFGSVKNPTGAFPSFTDEQLSDHQV